MGYDLQINYNTFQDMLIHFSDLVHEKKAEKMPYQDWRELTSLIPEGEIINIFVDDTYIELSIYGGYTEYPWVFRTGDNSFGDFLYENLLKHYKVSEHTFYSGDAISVGYDNPAIKSNTDWNYVDAKVAAISTSIDTKADVNALNGVEDKINSLVAEIAAASPMKNRTPNPNNNIIKNKKENNTMKFNFDFGPVNANTVRMSMYGLAVKNKTGTWVSFDATSGNIVDVDVFNFDGAKFLYKMPVAVKDVAVGDVVIHHGAPMFVLSAGVKTLTVVDVINGERKDIMLARSPFGFDFVTKVVNFLGNIAGGTATAENPFGNMWMLMAMSGDTSFEDMLPMALMAGGNFDMSNPMMMWALMGNRTNDPMMLAMAMGMFNKPAAPAHPCTCGTHCGENHTQN